MNPIRRLLSIAFIVSTSIVAPAVADVSNDLESGTSARDTVSCTAQGCLGTAVPSRSPDLTGEFLLTIGTKRCADEICLDAVTLVTLDQQTHKAARLKLTAATLPNVADDMFTFGKTPSLRIFRIEADAWWGDDSSISLTIRQRLKDAWRTAERLDIVSSPVAKACAPLHHQPEGAPDFSGTFEMSFMQPICRVAPCPPSIVFRAGDRLLGRSCTVTQIMDGKSVWSHPSIRSFVRRIDGELWIRGDAAFLNARSIEKIGKDLAPQ